jgi:hypothetical protein
MLDTGITVSPRTHDWSSMMTQDLRQRGVSRYGELVLFAPAVYHADVVRLHIKLR